MNPMHEHSFYQTAPYYNNLQKQVIQFVNEEFRPIKGHEDFLISNYGRVYSNKTGCIMNEFTNKDGYLQCNVDRTPMKIHRLVAEAFIPNPDPKNNTSVKYISGSKTNNHVSNLEWSNSSEITKSSYQNNLEKPKFGEKNGRALHTEAEVRQICSLLEQRLSFRQIADRMGYEYPRSKHFIANISSRSAWSHVSKDYKF
jgi:hypothetical protein